MQPFKALHDAASLFETEIHENEMVYSVELMKKIHSLREYEFDLRVGNWVGDYPAMFRAHHPIRLSNQRQMLVSIDTIDKDPLSDDTAVISGCGTGLGIDFQGVYGVITTRSRFSQYYRPELDDNGKPIVIVRKYIGNTTGLGK